MKKVFYVYHNENPSFRCSDSTEGMEFELVAKVMAETIDDVWRLTNNVDGSWSKGEFIDYGEGSRRNGDYSQDITVMCPLPIYDGVEYGLRSSSVGDVVFSEGKWLMVDISGWKEIEKPKAIKMEL